MRILCLLLIVFCAFIQSAESQSSPAQGAGLASHGRNVAGTASNVNAQPTEPPSRTVGAVAGSRAATPSPSIGSVSSPEARHAGKQAAATTSRAATGGR